MIDSDNAPLALAGITLLALIAPLIYSFFVDRYAPRLYKDRDRSDNR